MVTGNFEAIIEASKQPVLGAIGRYIATAADRDDVAQTVYLKLYTLWQNGKLQHIEKPSTYFYTIAKHETFRWNKKYHGTVPLEEDVAAEASVEESQHLKDVIATLPEKDSTLLNYFLAGFKLEEMGQLTSRNLNTIKTQFRRAKQRLALALKEKS